MSQLPTDIEAGDSGEISHTNELNRLHNQLDDALASTGDILMKGAAAWQPKTLAEASISAVGHAHTESDISDLTSHYTTSDFTTDLAAADLSGLDATAVHDNVAGEITAVTLKATPASNDVILVEDSAAANVKKRITVGSIASAGVTPGLEVDLLSENTSLTSSGIYIIDTDTAAGNVTITLPALSGTPAAGYDIKVIREGAYLVYVKPAGTEEFWDTTTQKTLFDEYAAISCVSRQSGSLWYMLGTYKTVT